ncbi:MAG TPA: PAS domain S-box protein [Clostridium sp.]
MKYEFIKAIHYEHQMLKIWIVDYNSEQYNYEVIRMRDDFYKSIINESPTGYAYYKIICDEEDIPYDYEFIEVNSAFERFIGLKGIDIIGKRITEIFPEISETERNWIKIYGDIAINGGSKEIEGFSEVFKGECKVKVYSPEKYCFITYIIDTSNEKIQLTELKNIKEMVEKTKLKYKTILDCTYDWETWKDTEGKLKYVSPACERISGYTVEEFLQDESLFESIILEEDKYIWTNKVHEIDNNMEISREQFRIKNKNGKIVWIEHNCRPIIDKYGSNLGYRASKHDITVRKYSEKMIIENELQFQRIIENLPFSISIISDDGTILYANQKALELFEYGKDEIGSKTMPILWVEPEERNIWIKTIKDRGIVKDFEMQLQTRTGKTFWSIGNALIIQYQNQTCILSTQYDITARKLVEDALKISEEKYRLLTEYASDVIWILNLKTSKFTYISPSVLQLRGLTVEEAMNERLEDALTPESLLIMRNVVTKNVRNFIDNPDNPKYYINEIQQPCKNGCIVWIEVSTKYRYNSDGHIEVVGVSRNIEKRKKSEREVLYLSYHDQLTGLYNRRFYEEELMRLDKQSNLPVTLVVADVNGLKLTNDAFGHLVGDELLKRFATILKKESRKEDIIARTGGDEFVLLFPKTNSLEAEKIVKRIKESIDKEKSDKTILSVSFGWATKSDIDDDFDKIYMQADDNMYHKKLLESTSMKRETIKLITRSLYEKNAIEQLHCERVSKFCKDIGIAMGLSSNLVDELGLLGLFHDIGKIGINKSFLNKSGKLEKMEWIDIKRHPEIGYQILKSVNEFSHIAEYVLSHHERLDGNGYPRNLKDTEIPLQAKILSIAEAYDTMTNEYSYKAALSESEAIKELKLNSYTQFDGEIARIFVEKVLGQKWN